MFELSISTSNSAFEAGPDGENEGSPEVARILREIADSVEAGNMAGTARDSNGNNVGRWSLTIAA